MYAQIEENLADHEKTKRAARALRVSPVQVVGHLACLWAWVVRKAPSGDLSDYEARDISDGARWTRGDDFTEEADASALAFVEALVACKVSADGAGFLERAKGGRLTVHDWCEYGGKVAVNRFRDAFRKKHGRMPTAEEIRESGLAVCAAESGPAPAASAPPPAHSKPGPTADGIDHTDPSDDAYCVGGKWNWAELAKHARQGRKWKKAKDAEMIEALLQKADKSKTRRHLRDAVDDVLTKNPTPFPVPYALSCLKRWDSSAEAMPKADPTDPLKVFRFTKDRDAARGAAFDDTAPAASGPAYQRFSIPDDVFYSPADDAPAEETPRHNIKPEDVMARMRGQKAAA